MFDRQQLLTIHEFDADKIKALTDEQISVFTFRANTLIDNFPAMEEKIQAALKEKDRETLATLLADLCEWLRQIYVDQMADIICELIGSLVGLSHEEVQASVITFLKAVSSLSIDLQMARFREKPVTLAEASQRTTAGNTILAVDDRSFFLTAIQSMLRDTGYKVTCVNSGMAALSFLKDHEVDLFILDIDMPVMDGYELADKIHEGGHTAPIIFLTGNAKQNSVVRALQAGASDFLVKPVNKEQLLSRIIKYIEPGSLNG